MDNIDTLQNVLNTLDKLSLQGFENWRLVGKAAAQVAAVMDDLKRQQEAREKAYEESLKEAKARREETLAAAHERGEEILGGQTVRFNADGTQEVLIP